MNACECKTEDDVLKHLVSFLTWYYPELPADERGWQLQMGYRRAFTNHQVWYHAESGRYAWYISEEKEWITGDETNALMFNSFADLLSGVARKHTSIWSFVGDSNTPVE